MKEEDDPFMGFFKLLEGRHPGAQRLGLRIEEAFETFLANLVAASYLLVSSLIILLILSPLLILFGNQEMRNIGGFMHVASGLLMLCHQLPYRSFIVGGVPMPICARDLGIYLGSIAGFATVFLKDKPKILSSIKILAVAVVPMALDGVTQTVLVLRESNNIIRLATGLAFGFGVMAYVANRMIIWRWPRFREQVVGTKFVVGDAVLVVFALYLLHSGFASELPSDYMGRGDAVSQALRITNISSPSYVDAYFVSSFAPLSVMQDPYYGSHKDLVLDDIIGSDFAKSRLLLFSGRKEANFTGTENAAELLAAITEENHNLGIWAVAVMRDRTDGGGSPYIGGGSGEIYYFDAYTWKLIMAARH